jgi:gas vesicle protein
MGYVRGIVHGTAIGTVIGLCIAPQEGTRTRRQIQQTVEQARAGMQRAQETARAVMPRAQVAMRTVADTAGQVRGSVERRRHQDGHGDPYVSVNGSAEGPSTTRD